VLPVMSDHVRLLVEHHGGSHGVRDFRKHTSWYMTGYPVGPEVRRRLAMVESVDEVDDVLGELDPTLTIVPGGERIRRGHTNGPIKVALPEGYLDRLDDLTVPEDGEVMALSGG
jgi:hypothetical protein